MSTDHEENHMTKIHATPKRAGGEKRGNSTDRRRRRLWMLARWGDGTTCPCTHCGETLTERTVEADRIIPGSLGGTYRRENIQPACRACNAARSDNIEWAFQDETSPLALAA
jgi:5-methylcytosine-specific restriction endonuclease McrA